MIAGSSRDNNQGRRGIPSPRHRVPESSSLYQAPERLAAKVSTYRGRMPCIVNIIAPVGYGKTSLAAAVSRTFFSRHIWLTLTEEYSPDLPFRSDLARAFQEAGFVFSEEPESGEIFHDQTPVCLVLDNLHLLPREESSCLIRLFSVLPQKSLIVLCSDEDHSLPLSLLRIDNRILELRIEDMAATKADAEAFFARLGSSPSGEELELVLQKTGGWWACIRLFAVTWAQLTTDDRKNFLIQFRATDRFIREFLTENIDSRLFPEHIHLLQSISVCSHIRIELAAILCGQQEDLVRKSFHDLELRYLLLPGGHGWYRLPVMLKQYYYAGLDRETRKILHRRASEWFGLQQMPKMTAHHLRKAGIQSPLAPRETEILVQASRGLNNAEIGEQLFISQGTVKWHMNRILEKLGCSNRTAAVEIARKNGFITV
ncbi:LuxR C-terminal-related transcriptional regulator [Marispirochaeta sp.]|uniref:LuxR C-terminal-related transcriptional regulator n=1 Tax=Marispirochaeta sp. TaxID=2038653 RepID=UPI0029C64E27|nr:LuxR C-terminal-related transcriptional regulator [Marispirochaeta sp.]